MHFQPRQFPRVSLATDVKVECGNEVFVCRSQEIGAGGMALEDVGRLGVAQPVRVSFTLPSRPEVSLDAVVWWKRDRRVGIRFDPRDGKSRGVIQQWVEEQIKLAQTPPV